MFISREVIKETIKDIIYDGVDNDIVFIVANKGLGKHQLLNEIYSSESFNSSIIVADGKCFKEGIGSSLQKCYIHGIYKYLLSHNNVETRKSFKESVGYYKDNLPFKTLFEIRTKLRIQTIVSMLSGLNITELKDIYTSIAYDIPLVMFINAVRLEEKDKEYIKRLKSEGIKARITYILTVRPDSIGVELMNNVISYKSTRIWIFPVLPSITCSASNTHPTSIASIAITNVGDSSSYLNFRNSLSKLNEYNIILNLVHDLLLSELDTFYTCILARLEIIYSDYEYLEKITKRIYKTRTEINTNLVLQHEGKFQLLDSLAYYLVMRDGISKLICSTQIFFFDILLNIDNIVKTKADRNQLISFLKKMSSQNENLIATGFSSYFNEFAYWVRRFFILRARRNNLWIEAAYTQQFLSNCHIEFSVTNIKALEMVYDETQMCNVLDLGLLSIQECINYYSASEYAEIAQYTVHFIEKCFVESYKWNDELLINRLTDIVASLNRKGFCSLFYFPFITTNETMFLYLSMLLKKNNIRIGDVFMPKKTVFISYTHKDIDIAEAIDLELRNYGYDVKLDNRDASTWSNLKEFMKSIRSEDYVITLVSDTYLHRNNCMYEIVQLLKDDSYKGRTFPIVIEFPESDNKSMFTVDYHFEIVSYWQQVAKTLNEKLKTLDIQNVVELASEYRDIIEMAPAVSKFMSYCKSITVATLKPENPIVAGIVKTIDDKINMLGIIR